MKHYVLILITLLVTCSVLQAQTIVEAHGKLRVDGTKIRDESNRIVELRGISYFWHQWSNNSAYMNDDVVKWLRDDWKVQLIRVPIGVRAGFDCNVMGTRTLAAGECEGNPGGITGKEWGYQVARRAIRAAINQGVYVIIDWHTHDIHLNEAKEFFRTMAQEFGDSPNIIYEIFNEPDFKTRSDGSTVVDETWPEIKAYAEQIIPVIRQYDPDNIIVVGTPFWDQQVDKPADDPITGDLANNVAYTVHIYVGSHDGLEGVVNYALSKGICLFATENGSTAAQFNTDANGNLWPNYWDRWDRWTDVGGVYDKNDISWVMWSLGTKYERNSMLQPGASTAGNWNYNTDLTENGRRIRNQLRRMNSIPDAPTNPPPTTTGNVTVRARGTVGGEQLEIRYQDQRVGDRITLGTSFQEYKVQVNQANGNFKVAFVNDNGPRDAIIDWLQVGSTRRQAESRSVNTGAWGNNTCGGGSFTETLNCSGYIGFGTMSSGSTGQVVIRARGTCGSETMILQVGGKDVKTWTNLSTSFTNYTYSNYSGSQNVKVRFTNDGRTGSGCDKNLVVDKITVCDQVRQAENVTRNGCGSEEWLYCNGNFDFGTVSCGSARTASGAEKGIIADAESKLSDRFNSYPNPASQELTVEGTADYQVTLYDLTGRAVMRHNHLRGRAKLDIHHLRPGLYLMKLRDADQQEVSRRLIIE